MRRLLALSARRIACSLLPALAGFACSASTTVDLLPETSSAGVGNTGIAGATAALGGSSAASTSGGAGTGGTTASSTNANGWPAELIHLYDFAGTGTNVVDRVDGSVGTIEGATSGGTAALDGSGQLSITDGVSYVKLPSWLIKNAKSSSITFAIWFTWNGSASWARVFDFGATNEGDNTPGTALAQFYFTPMSEPNHYYSVLLNNDCNSGAQAVVEPAASFPIGEAVYVAVVVEGDEILGTSTLHLYLNGTEVGTPSTVAQRLTEFTDQNCWLGLSQWIQDNSVYQHFNGSYDEFRIYSRALTAAEVTALSLDDPSLL
jgi:hypothetical protein